MSKSKNNRYNPESYETVFNSPDWWVFLTLNAPLLTSPAFIDLSKGQKLLYIYCKLQRYAEKPKPDGELSFTMNRQKWHDKYQLYSSGNANSFYADIEALILHGFIICSECNQTCRKKNVYKFSDKWKQFPNVEVTPAEMTGRMLKKLREHQS